MDAQNPDGILPIPKVQNLNLVSNCTLIALALDGYTYTFLLMKMVQTTIGVQILDTIWNPERLQTRFVVGIQKPD